MGVATRGDVADVRRIGTDGVRTGDGLREGKMGSFVYWEELLALRREARFHTFVV